LLEAGPKLNFLLSFTDLAGKSQALQVKETPTEVRIQLAADVLFDFDKSEVRQSAADALRQIASLINALSLRRAESLRQSGW
jgi:outer membrane protein OmpA-like peptidoglycan-associated protein